MTLSDTLERERRREEYLRTRYLRHPVNDCGHLGVALLSAARRARLDRAQAERDALRRWQAARVRAVLLARRGEHLEALSLLAVTLRHWREVTAA